jgi:hypothetical protein
MMVANYPSVRMLATTLHSCYFNPVAQLWCFGFQQLTHRIHWQPLIIATWVLALSLALALLVVRLIDLAQVSSARSHNCAPRSVLVSHSGRCKSSESSGHTVIPEDICCICDRKRKTIFRCRNIADNVCLGCVVQWTIQNPNGSNPWPCCRPPSPTESSR